MVDSLSVLGHQVNHASPARLQELYGEIGLEMVYNAKEWMVDVTIRPPRRVNACVRGRFGHTSPFPKHQFRNRRCFPL
jgi:hypothetical protein